LLKSCLCSRGCESQTGDYNGYIFGDVLVVVLDFSRVIFVENIQNQESAAVAGLLAFGVCVAVLLALMAGDSCERLWVTYPCL
jgi:hypothetical protein